MAAMASADGADLAELYEPFPQLLHFRLAATRLEEPAGLARFGEPGVGPSKAIPDADVVDPVAVGQLVLRLNGLPVGFACPPVPFPRAQFLGDELGDLVDAAGDQGGGNGLLGRPDFAGDVIRHVPSIPDAFLAGSEPEVPFLVHQTVAEPAAGGVGLAACGEIRMDLPHPGGAADEVGLERFAWEPHRRRVGRRGGFLCIVHIALLAGRAMVPGGSRPGQQGGAHRSLARPLRRRLMNVARRA